MNIYLAFKYLYRNKRRKITLIIVIVLLVLCVMVNSYRESIINYLNYAMYKSIDGKILSVSSYEYRSEEERKKVLAVDHVQEVFFANGSFTKILNTEFKTEISNGDINAHVASNNTLPKIINGTNFPDSENNYLICPEKFYPIVSLDKQKSISTKDFIDLSDYLNKKITFKYFAPYAKEVGNYVNMDFILIGLYENNEYDLDYATCYTQENSIYQIFYGQETLGIEDFGIENEISLQKGFFVQVDDKRNVSKVIEALTALKYEVEPVIQLDEVYIKNLNESITFFSVLILILSLIMILVLLKKDFIENKKYYKLLKCLGYRSKDIQKIEFFSGLLNVSAGFIITIILAFFVKIFLLVVTYFRPFIFNKMKILISFKEVGLIYLCILLILIFRTLIYKDKRKF